VLLATCGRLQPPSGAPGAISQTRPGRYGRRSPWIVDLPDATRIKKLLYISDGATNSVFVKARSEKVGSGELAGRVRLVLGTPRSEQDSMFPNIESFESGMLDVGDSQEIYWECSGNPSGRPVVYLHGGPGSGCTARNRCFFDPSIYRIILTDQRGCGRSRPHVEKVADLEVNTTPHLIGDLERLREHLGVDRWVVVAGSWGTTLGLAYAQANPHRVGGMVLACVTTTSRREVAWITGDIGRVFPEQWERFASVKSHDETDHPSLPDIYAALVFNADAEVRDLAAREWCAWENTHVSLAPGYVPSNRFEDPAYRLLFTRLVTHYWRHAAFLSEDQLIRNASRLNGIPGILLHGRYDISSPLETAWRLHQAWRGSVLRVIGAGHGGDAMSESVVEAMNASRWP
jgi:proline iminopeptidase